MSINEYHLNISTSLMENIMKNPIYSTWSSSDSESLSSYLFTLFLQLLHLQASMHATDACLHKQSAMEQLPRQPQDRTLDKLH